MAEHTLSYVDRDRRERGFAAPYLCLAFEAERPCAAPLRLSIAEVDEVAIGRGERAAIRTSDAGVARLVVSAADGWMSTRHARLARTADGWVVEDLGSKNGTFVDGERIERARLTDGALVEVGATLFLFRDSVIRLPGEAVDAVAAGEPAFATLSPPWSRALAAVDRVAASRVPIVLHGETGTGKEVLARAIHARSGRGPFVALNAGALPEALVEGELFGHRKGAFSGAIDDRPGLVRAADRGTLFLDEISELPAAAQVKLLRVLQEGEVTPLGATRPVPVDVRVLSASHRSLPAEVEAGRFRADLYARLAGHTVELPPLRERREDLGLLVGALLGRQLGARAARAAFEREAARGLFRHRWPLNVRELEHALGAAIALAGQGRIELQHLSPAIGQAARARRGDDDDALRDQLVRLFTLHRGNLSAVAREMGKERVQIRRWCKRFGLDADQFRTADEP